MPEDIGGSPARTLRIGLGPLTARQARVEAELLAALARTRFEQIRTARMQDDHPESDEGDIAPAIAAAEVKGYLMAMRGLLDGSPPPTPPHQEPGFAGIRGLVSLNRELAKGAEGNPLVIDNADMLKAQSIARIKETVDIADGAKKIAPAPQQREPPAPPADTTGLEVESSPPSAQAPPSTGISSISGTTIRRQLVVPAPSCVPIAIAPSPAPAPARSTSCSAASAVMDFAYRDARIFFSNLPGVYASNPPDPWDPGAVSAHANAIEVAHFLQAILQRDGLDGCGGKIVSTVNCTWFGETTGQEWRNAARVPGQMIYGQRLIDGALRSYAASLDVVAHELFHGLTEHTARLEYRLETGALNESYSDVFGVIVANRNESDISRWDWRIGEDLTVTGLPLRDLSDPQQTGQPAHMDDYRRLPESFDHGGVHINSGIHNKAAFDILTAKVESGVYLFTAEEVAKIFYVTLVSHLSRTSDFSDSRRGVLLSARSIIPNDDPFRGQKIMAIEKAFDDVGITDRAPAIA